MDIVQEGFPTFGMSLLLPPLSPLSLSFSSLNPPLRSLWSPSLSRVLFSEVKGPGDQLSETQKVWIDVLLGAGVGVEVCKVVQSEEGGESSEEEGKKGRKRRKVVVAKKEAKEEEEGE